MALELGIGYKGVPVVAVPYFGFSLWRGGLALGKTSIAGMVLCVVAFLPFIVHYMWAGPGVWWFLRFHAERGTEVESLYASAAMAAQLFGFEARAAQEFGSWDLAGDGSTRLAAISTAILVAMYLSLAAWAWLSRYSLDRLTGLHIGCLAIVATAIAAKVLSPQYLIWALPLCLLLGMQFPRGKQFMLLVAVVLLTALLTTWIFPLHFFQRRTPVTGELRNHVALLQGLGSVRDFNSTAAVVLGIRNLLLLALLAWTGYRQLRSADAYGT
jgi:hypothetical protein